MPNIYNQGMYRTESQLRLDFKIKIFDPFSSQVVVVVPFSPT